MKLLPLLVLLFSAHLLADTKAITDDGRVVILKSDGTWVYEGKPPANVEIPYNNELFTKSSDATFLIKSKKTNSTFSINPQEWNFKGDNNGHPSAEYTFKLKDGDLWGLAISEEVEMAIEELANLAYNNAKAVAPDMTIVKKEYRKVNDANVIYMEMEGTVQTMKIKYIGLYFANRSGSTQFTVYTGQSLVTKYQTQISKLLNGFNVGD